MDLSAIDMLLYKAGLASPIVIVPLLAIIKFSWARIVWIVLVVVWFLTSVFFFSQVGDGSPYQWESAFVMVGSTWMILFATAAFLWRSWWRKRKHNADAGH